MSFPRSRGFRVTPSARKRLPQREHRTPRRPRPQPGPERPQPMTIAATIPDELAARVPGDSADRGDFRRRGPNRVCEEGRSSAVDLRGAMVEGWPTIGPSLGPPRCNSDEPERSHKTQRREKESRETGHFFLFDLGLARFFSAASVAHRVLASQDSGIGHQLRNSLRPLLTPRKSGPASSLNNHSIILDKIGDPRRTPRIAQTWPAQSRLRWDED